MTRPALRRRSLVRLESLESRELLTAGATAGGPSADAQFMLELINLARTNPAAAADWVTANVDADVAATCKYYGIDLNQVHNEIAASPARPALAWDDRLAVAAIKHSLEQVQSGVQSHLGVDGSTLDQRLDRVGYTDRAVSGENAYAYSRSVDHAMEAFLIDWGVADHGHRNNIQQPDSTPDHYYKQVGIGIIDSNRANIGPKVITVNFGTQAHQPAILVGVAYNDPNHDHRYGLGEGQGDVEIDATNIDTGEVKTTYTWESGGGYQVPLNPGTYKLQAKVNGQVVRTDQISMGDQNVKVDYDLSDPWQTQPAPVAVAHNPAPVQQAPAAQPQAQTLTVASKSAPVKTGWFSSWNSWTARKAF